MPILRMMLRLFTSIFGTTHPSEEHEDKYAVMLFATVLFFLLLTVGATWIALRVIG